MAISQDFCFEQGMNFHDSVDKEIKEEPSSSSDDDEEPNKWESQGSFLCDICHSSNIDSCAKFKEQSHLVLHTYKNHPTACIGCFEVFDTLDDLVKHLKRIEHNLPMCRECWKLVPDKSYLIEHDCTGLRFKKIDRKTNTSSTDDTSDEELDRENCNNTRAVLITKDMHQKSDYKTAASNSQSVNAGQDRVMLNVKHERNSEEDDDIESMDSTSESEGMISVEDDDDDSVGASNENLSCIHCNLDDFCDQNVLRLHTLTVHPTVCLICFEGFENEENLRNHQNAMKHHTWTCSSCNKYFLRRLLYRKHLTKNHPEKCPFHCPDCKEYGSFRIGYLNNHRQIAHGVGPYSLTDKGKTKGNWNISSLVCSICLKYFMTSYSYGLHMLKEHNEPGQTHVYKCELCGFGFGRGKSFERHLKRFHSDDTDYLESVKQVLESTLKLPTKCDICDRETPRLLTHIVRHHPHLRPHKCHICGMGFIEESDVKVHLHHDHNGPSPFVCPICDVTYPRMINLARHLKREHKHEGMPMFYCFKHKRGSYSTDIFNDHLVRMHPEITNIKRPATPAIKYPCPECNKEFTAVGLKAHIRHVHTEREAKYKCDQCGKSFKEKVLLKTHKNVHTDNFQCADCGKSFQAQHFLNRHRVVHSGEKPFKCEICGLGVSQRSALLRHLKVVHPNGKLKEGYRPYSRKPRAPKSKAEKETVINGYNKQDMEAEMNEASRDDTTLTKEVKRNLRKRTVQYKDDSASSSDESYKPKKQSRGSSRPRKKRKVEQDDEWQASDDEDSLSDDSEEEFDD